MSTHQTRRDCEGLLWYGYQRDDETLWHYEHADTDMGDLTTSELERYFGPTTSTEN